MPSSAPQQTQILYHLGYRIPSEIDQLRHLRATRYVLLCGTSARARKIAAHFSKAHCKDICRTERFTILAPTPGVVVAAHGIGNASLDVLLHELYHALHLSGAKGWSMIRVGSCGGVGVPAGSIVITKNVVNGAFQSVWRLFVLGEEVVRNARLDWQLGDALYEHGRHAKGLPVVRGDTLCAESFYEAQGRLDGAFAGYSEEEKMAFLHRCRDKGVVNFEMEGLALAAFGARVGVPTAVVCAVMVDRLAGETPMINEKEMGMFEDEAVGLVVGFVTKMLARDRRDDED